MTAPVYTIQYNTMFFTCIFIALAFPEIVEICSLVFAEMPWLQPNRKRLFVKRNERILNPGFYGSYGPLERPSPRNPSWRRGPVRAPMRGPVRRADYLPMKVLDPRIPPRALDRYPVLGRDRIQPFRNPSILPNRFNRPNWDGYQRQEYADMEPETSYDQEQSYEDFAMAKGEEYRYSEQTSKYS